MIKKYIQVLTILLIFGSLFVSHSAHADTSNTTPFITLISPNGGESFTEGEEVIVKWDSKNIPHGTKIGIYLFSSEDTKTGLGSEYEFDNVGEQAIIIPYISVRMNNWHYGKNFKIVVYRNTPTDSVKDESDALFTINPVSSVRSASTSNTSSTSPQGTSSGTKSSSWTRESSGTTSNNALTSVVSVWTKQIVLPESTRQPTTNTSAFPSTTTDLIFTRTLRIGMKGEDVKALQVLVGVPNPDGKFGPKTLIKVKEWQRKNNLKPDGVLGAQGRVKLSAGN